MDEELVSSFAPVLSSIATVSTSLLSSNIPISLTQLHDDFKG